MAVVALLFGQCPRYRPKPIHFDMGKAKFDQGEAQRHIKLLNGFRRYIQCRP